MVATLNVWYRECYSTIVQKLVSLGKRNLCVLPIAPADIAPRGDLLSSKSSSSSASSPSWRRSSLWHSIRPNVSPTPRTHDVSPISRASSRPCSSTSSTTGGPCPPVLMRRSGSSGPHRTGVPCVTARAALPATPVSKYLKSMPYDPKNGAAERTHYTIQVDSNNIVTVIACDSTDTTISSVSR